MDIQREIAAGATSTVPVPTASTTGTFQTVPTSGNRLYYNGTDDLSLTLSPYVNPWLYFPVANVIFQIFSIGANVVFGRPGVSVTVNGEVGQIVEGIDVDYEIVNLGAGTVSVTSWTGTVSVPTGAPLKGKSISRQKLLTLYPVIVTTSGSIARVTEQQ